MLLLLAFNYVITPIERAWDWTGQGHTQGVDSEHGFTLAPHAALLSQYALLKKGKPPGARCPQSLPPKQGEMGDLCLPTSLCPALDPRWEGRWLEQSIQALSDTLGDIFQFNCNILQSTYSNTSIWKSLPHCAGGWTCCIRPWKIQK